MEEQLKGAMERLQSRAGSLSEELLQLREAKFGTEAALLDASHRAAAAEGALSSLEAEAEALRQRCASAAADRAQSAADSAELRSRLLSAEEKVAALPAQLAFRACLFCEVYTASTVNSHPPPCMPCTPKGMSTGCTAGLSLLETHGLPYICGCASVGGAEGGGGRAGAAREGAGGHAAAAGGALCGAQAGLRRP